MTNSNNHYSSEEHLAHAKKYNLYTVLDINRLICIMELELNRGKKLTLPFKISNNEEKEIFLSCNPAYIQIASQKVSINSTINCMIVSPNDFKSFLSDLKTLKRKFINNKTKTKY